MSEADDKATIAELAQHIDGCVKVAAEALRDRNDALARIAKLEAELASCRACRDKIDCLSR